jgi:DNA/RNA endonuclease YhcR with UshA esterase domain
MKPAANLIRVLSALLLTGSLHAQKILDVGDIESIRAARGTEITVRGKISRSSKSKSGINFINFPGEKFSAVMFTRDAKHFPGGEPADLFEEGDVVEITGTVEFYKEKPQIALTRSNQIRLAPGQPAEEAAKQPEPTREDPEKAAAPAQREKPEKQESPKIKRKPDPRKYFTD